jgi:hypothetical protein
MLLLGVEVYGIGKWALAKRQAKAVLRYRSPGDLKDRYRNLLKHM